MTTPVLLTIAHAISDPIRLKVIAYLQANGKTCVGDLSDALGVAQSKLSFHIKCLKEAGIITAHPQGRWCYYSLAPERLEAFAGAVLEMLEGDLGMAEDHQERYPQYREP